MDDIERVARGMAAKKMGLIKDHDGMRLPDDLWQQAIPAAQDFLDQLAHEIAMNERRQHEERAMAEHYEKHPHG